MTLFVLLCSVVNHRLLQTCYNHLTIAKQHLSFSLMTNMTEYLTQWSALDHRNPTITKKPHGLTPYTPCPHWYNKSIAFPQIIYTLSFIVDIVTHLSCSNAVHKPASVNYVACLKCSKHVWLANIWIVFVRWRNRLYETGYWRWMRRIFIIIDLCFDQGVCVFVVFQPHTLS